MRDALAGALAVWRACRGRRVAAGQVVAVAERWVQRVRIAAGPRSKVQRTCVDGCHAPRSGAQIIGESSSQ